MKDKLELQKQYIEVKNKYDELSELYWSTSYDSQGRLLDNLTDGNLYNQIKDTFTLLKSLNKQIYYES